MTNKLKATSPKNKFGIICRLNIPKFSKFNYRQLKSLFIYDKTNNNSRFNIRIGRLLLSERIYLLGVAKSILTSRLKAIILKNKLGRTIYRQISLTLHKLDPRQLKLQFISLLNKVLKSRIGLLLPEYISLYRLALNTKIIKLKTTILKNKFGRLICRHIILTLRKLSPWRFAYLLIKDDRLRQNALKTRWGAFLLSEQIYLMNFMLSTIEKHTRNPNILFRISKVYLLQKKYSSAFNIILKLIFSEKNETKLVIFTIKALQAERQLEEKKLMKLFMAGELPLPEKAIHFLTCEYTLHSDDIVPDWENISILLKKDFDYALANFFILAALGHKKIKYIDQVCDLLISRKHESHELYFERTATVIATSYYRSGEKNKLKLLDKTFNFDSSNWKLYMAFGHGKILEAMRYRGVGLKNTFLRFYPIQTKLNKQNVLVPEKDICGEAFNALFYAALYKNRGDFIVTCDNRLLTILQRTFPYIHFIPKTPRYMQKSSPEKFNHLNGYLRDFMDHSSFYQTRGANFFNIDYENLYEQEDTKNGRQNGWLKTDERLREHWIKEFGKSKKLIGVSANSTVRSRIRDIHMISMDRWEEIFKLPNCKFINLNASLTEEEINIYAKQYNIDFITPDIDLFNDFDNLLAIMSILDFAIVPANNMMDFSASLGINTLVFSPSNIMKTWAIKDDNYIFSEKVKFIFPKTENNKIERMVKDGARYIDNTIKVN